MNDLPPGWAWATVGELGEDVRVSVKPEPGVNYELYSVPTYLTGKPELLDGSEIGSNKRAVRPGDVLLCKINPRINRVWIVAEPSGVGPQLASPEYLILRTADLRLARYLRWYFQSPRFRAWIELSVEGATGSHTRAKSGPILEQVVPVPPAHEQERIVAAIEEHLSRLDAADAAVDSAHRRNDVLVQRLIDTSWEGGPTVTLDDLLAQPLANGRSVRTDPDGFPVLRLTALKNRRIDLAERKTGAWTAEQARQFLVQEGDFLVSRGNGSLSLVGRGGVVDAAPDPVAYPDTLIRVRVRPTDYDVRFLSLVWDSTQVRRQLEEQARTTAGIYKVNQEMLRRTTLPAPSLEVQGEIVSRVDAAIANCERVRVECSRSQQRSGNLRRSMLAAAFSGQLVPQDPDDEPAASLLDQRAAAAIKRSRKVRAS